MVQHRETATPSPQPDILDRAFRRLDRAASAKDHADASEQIVSLSTLEQNDALSIMRALEKGTTLLPSKKKLQHAAGNSIVQGVETYFQESVYVYKSILPTFGDFDKHKKQLERSLRAVEKSLRIDRGRQELPGIEDFLYKINYFFSQATLTQNNGVIRVMPHERTRRLREPELETIFKLQNEVLETVGRFMSTDDTRDRIGISEKVIRSLEQTSAIHLEIPDTLTREYNGVSIKSILAENDTPLKAKMLLSYMAAMPKGDELLMRSITGIFFSAALTYEHIDAEASFQNPERVKQLFATHSHLSSKIFLPHLFPDEVDEDFDRLFNSAVRNLPPFIQSNLAILMYVNLLHDPLRRTMFDSDASGERMIEKSQLTQYIAKEYTALYPRKPLLIQDHLHTFVRENWSGFFQNVKSRFNDKEFIDALERIHVGMTLGTNPDRDTQRFFLEHIIQEEDFLDRLDQYTEQLQQSVSTVKEDITPNGKIEPLGLQGTQHTVNLQSPLHTQVLGFELMQFSFGNSANEPIYAYLGSTSNDYDMFASIGSDASVTEWSSPFNQQTANLRILLEQIVLVGLHDVLLKAGNPVNTSDITNQLRQLYGYDLPTGKNLFDIISLLETSTPRQVTESKRGENQPEPQPSTPHDQGEKNKSTERIKRLTPEKADDLLWGDNL